MKLYMLISMAFSALWLAGCSKLPVGGPSHRAIDEAATEAHVNFGERAVVDYVVVDIDRGVLEHVVSIGPASFFKTFGTGQGSSPELRLGVGDVLSITIFESSSGGLFVPSEAGSRPGNYVTLPAQNIDSDGHITVPFAGKIRAAGKSIAAVQRDIEGQLAKRAIEPKVVINLSEQNATEVAVFGDATGGLKTKIAPGGERILDVIARAGVRYPGYEIFVTLQRADTRATVFFPNLVNRPYENIYVNPGDIIYVYRQPQTYIAVGAIGTITQTQGLTGRFDFEAAHLSLAEAVAKAGGLLDTRANAAQVFLYRLEDREILERFGMDLDKFDPNMPLIPTIYRANYRDPSAFFVADGFPMRHKDIIYVANADSVEIEKFLGLVSTVSGTIAQVAVDTVTTLDPSGAN
jgi:polysaccharide export outer membrane protein